jgi:hypothetical protein
MLTFATLDFDPTDSQDQYAIIYNNYKDRSGDDWINWFDTEEERARRVEKDIQDGIIFLSQWRKKGGGF